MVFPMMPSLGATMPSATGRVGNSAFYFSTKIPPRWGSLGTVVSYAATLMVAPMGLLGTLFDLQSNATEVDSRRLKLDLSTTKRQRDEATVRPSDSAPLFRFAS